MSANIKKPIKYEPFNGSGTMLPPSPEMVEEQISLDEAEECPHGIGFDEECKLCLPYEGEIPDILT